GAIALGCMWRQQMPLQLSRTAPLKWTRTSSRFGEVVVGGFIPARGAAACRTAGAITAIGPTMDTGPTGGLIMVAGTIHIGVTDIGMGTDGQSTTKSYKKRNSRLTIPL